MQALYEGDRPRHHQDSAKSLDYQEGLSQFFITSLEDFSRLQPAQVQEVFRNRHIVIPGQPPEDFKFDKRGLSRLASLRAPMNIQGLESRSGFRRFSYVIVEVESRRTKTLNEKMLCRGNLASLLETKSGK